MNKCPNECNSYDKYIKPVKENTREPDQVHTHPVSMETHILMSEKVVYVLCQAYEIKLRRRCEVFDNIQQNEINSRDGTFYKCSHQIVAIKTMR